MPIAGRASNDEALPNPWRRPAAAATASPVNRINTHSNNVAPSPSAASSVPSAPETYPYERQLKVLTGEMGFDEDVARLALEQSSGDVDAAVNLIAEWSDE